LLMEMMDKSLRSSMDMERQLQIRPLMTIPYVTTSAETRKQGRKTGLILRVGLGLLLVAGILLHTLYLPFDELIQKVLHKVAGI